MHTRFGSAIGDSISALIVPSHNAVDSPLLRHSPGFSIAPRHPRTHITSLAVDGWVPHGLAASSNWIHRADTPRHVAVHRSFVPPHQFNSTIVDSLPTAELFTTVIPWPVS